MDLKLKMPTTPIIYQPINKSPVDFVRESKFSDDYLSKRKVKILRTIAVINLLVAICILIIGSSCVCAGYHLVYKCKLFVRCPGKTGSIMNCPAGTGIWQGAIAIVTSIMGIVATKNEARNRTLLVAYQAACILCSFLLWVLVGISAVFLAIFTSHITVYWYNDQYMAQPYWYNLMVANIIFDVALVALAVFYITLSLASTFLMCTTWHSCCPRERKETTTEPSKKGESGSDSDVEQYFHTRQFVEVI